ncbi:hypothetical protein ACIHCQ_33325 [Streptomyces sp. NPDC052236]|uniref:hypothetical protein n=1 Tax=Streptomyces sp. NPDC052236 TaxID=3365686 RepID=UPI0037CDB327
MASPLEWREARPKVAEARRRIWRDYSQDPNIVGVGFGARFRNGRRFLDQPVCSVFVVRKLLDDQLAPQQRLPRTVDVDGATVEIDVVESGRFHAYEFRARERPAAAGISIGHGDITAGTLGTLVTDTSTGNLAILSNNHVLANSNKAKIGDPIYQPGPADAPKTPNNIVGRLARFVPISFGDSTNRVDCAIAEPIGGGCDLLDDIKGDMTRPTAEQPAVGLLFAGGGFHTVLNPINDVVAELGVEMTAGPQARVGPKDLLPGTPVHKTGRTTEYTTGQILGIDVTVVVMYADGQIALFDGQILTSGMSCGGDSGSIVCRGGTGAIATADCLNNCAALRAAEDLTGIPFTQEWVAIRHTRDTYLQTTLLGQWALEVFFANQESGLSTAMATTMANDDRALAQALYAQYGTELKRAAFDPIHHDLQVTEQHIRDAETVLNHARPYLTDPEIQAAEEIFSMAQENVGKYASELRPLLDDQETYERIKGIIDATGSVIDPRP